MNPTEPTARPRTGAEPTYLNPADGKKGEDGTAPLRPDYSFLPDVAIPLVFPIEISGVPCSQLTLRRPKVKDNKFINKLKCADEDRGHRMLAHLTGLSPDEFDQLDVADVATMGEWLELFTSAKREL